MKTLCSFWGHPKAFWQDEKKVIHYVNDGLNRVLRGNPPPRERPPDSEKPRYENYWQARYVMEALADAIALVENSNGGRLKPSKMFKRLAPPTCLTRHKDV